MVRIPSDFSLSSFLAAPVVKMFCSTAGRSLTKIECVPSSAWRCCCLICAFSVRSCRMRHVNLAVSKSPSVHPRICVLFLASRIRNTGGDCHVAGKIARKQGNITHAIMHEAQLGHRQVKADRLAVGICISASDSAPSFIR